MDSDLEKHYLDKSNYTDEELSDIREKKYYHYRGKLMDFKKLFHNKINDVEFETIFEKLMNSFLDFRMVDLINSFRLLKKGFEPYKNNDGYEFSTEKYKDSLTHHDDELERVSDDKKD